MLLSLFLLFNIILAKPETGYVNCDGSVTDAKGGVAKCADIFAADTTGCTVMGSAPAAYSTGSEVQMETGATDTISFSVSGRKLVKVSDGTLAGGGSNAQTDSSCPTVIWYVEDSSIAYTAPGTPGTYTMQIAAQTTWGQIAREQIDIVVTAAAVNCVGDWGACSDDATCEQIYAISIEPVGTGDACDNANGDTQPCSDSSACPVDQVCEWQCANDFACQETYTITTAAENGGATDTCAEAVVGDNQACQDISGCPTCTDNIQNGDELNVDCGGSCDACEDCQFKDDTACTAASTQCVWVSDSTSCVDATCDDGIQNQDETDIDCGGLTCDACPVDCVGDWGACSDDYTCEQTYAISVEPVGTGDACPKANGDTQACSDSSACPVDQICEWQCANDLGCMETYTSTTDAANGGATCTAATVGDTQTCQDTTNCPQKSAVATFYSAVSGTITFNEYQDGTVSITLDVANTDGTPTVDHKWHIHTDAADPNDCSSAGGHYEPNNVETDQLNAGGYYCDPSVVSTCYVGDLSGKYGLMEIPDATSSFVDSTITFDDIVGRSVVIHDANSGSPRYDCATIENEIETFSGILMDVYCWDLALVGSDAPDGSNSITTPYNHKVKCLEKDICTVTGFGLVAPKDDDSGEFEWTVTFDEDTNDAVRAYLANIEDKFSDNVWVDVTGVLHEGVLKFGSVVESPNRVTHTGYLYDNLCYGAAVDGNDDTNAPDGSDAVLTPWSHKIGCYKLPECAESGFGLLEEDDANENQWTWKYSFDAAGDANAINFIENTHLTYNVLVDAAGYLEGDVLKYATMKEALIPEYTGFVVDVACYSHSAATGEGAGDGTIVTVNPQDHSVGCLLMPPCIESGYVILQEDTDDTNDLDYSAKYYFGAIGNEATVAWAQCTTAVDNVIFTVDGIVVPSQASDTVYPTLSDVRILSTNYDDADAAPCDEDDSDDDDDDDNVAGAIPNDAGLGIIVTVDETAETMSITVAGEADNGYFAVALSADDMMTTGDIAFVYDPTADPMHWVQALGTKSPGSPIADDEAVWVSEADVDGVHTFTVTVSTSSYPSYDFVDGDTGLNFLYVRGPNSFGFHTTAYNVATGYSINGIVAAASAQMYTFTGILMDVYCWDLALQGLDAPDGSNSITTPYNHKVKCLEKDFCDETGFGLVAPKDDDSGEFEWTVTFDEATNNAVRAYLANIEDKFSDNVWVDVTGGLDDDGILTFGTVEISPNRVTHTGYLYDNLCYGAAVDGDPETNAPDGSDAVNAPWTHMIGCYKLDVCMDSGFGLLEEDAANENQWTWKYSFDAAGDANAISFVENTHLTYNVLVNAAGYLDGDVLKYATMKEALIPEHTGFVIDVQCYNYSAITGEPGPSGSVPTVDPETHTVGCLLMPSCVASGYVILQEDTDDTNDWDYSAAYYFDAIGNDATVAWAESTTATDNVIFTVDGILLPAAADTMWYPTLSDVRIISTNHDDDSGDDDDDDDVSANMIPNSLGLTLSVEADATAGTMTITATGDSTGWFAVALSEDASMTSGDVAFIHDSTVDPPTFVQLLGTRSAGSAATVDDSVVFTVVSADSATTTMTVTFSTADYAEFSFGTDETPFSFLFATGGGSFAYHSARGVASGYTVASIAAGAAEGTAVEFEPTDEHTAHATCMFLAWGVFAPIAILAASTKKLIPQTKVNIQICMDKDPGPDNWFNVHRVCNSLAVIFSFIGAIIGFDMCAQDHLSFNHAKYGLSIVVLACFQPVIAYFRPHGGEPTRIYFNIYHISVGVFCAVAGFFNIMSGFEELEKYGGENTESKQTAVLIWFLIWLIVFLACQIYNYVIHEDGDKSSSAGSHSTEMGKRTPESKE